MALFEGQTTAWEDIQIKLGNFAEREPKGPSMEEISQETLARAEGICKQDFVDSLLSSRSIEPEDEDLAALRRARIEQMKRQDTLSTVRRITKESYMDEVTEGSKSAVIVVMMERKGGSSFLESECRKMAREWITETSQSKNLESVPARFYVGDVDDLVGVNFPSTSLPFAVIYSQGACQSQMSNATTDGIRSALIRVGKSIQSKPEKSCEDQYDCSRDIRRELGLRRRAFSSDSEEESDHEKNYQRGKGYSDLSFERNVLRFK
jgi:hypothetical protein